MISIRYVKAYCNNYTEIENYELAIADNTQIWDCHHRREISESKSKQQLISEGLYYDVPACDLIFLAHEEHIRLHKKDTQLSAEHRKKISENNARAWKGKQLSAEHRKKISENNARAMKGKPSPNRKQIEIEGVVYESVTAAAQAHGIAQNTMSYWLYKGKAKYI